MVKVTIGLVSTLLTLAAAANAQSVVNRVTGPVGGAGSAAGGATASATGSPASNNSTSLTNGAPGLPSSGGALPGALEFKAGDKIIQFRGAAGVGDDRGNFKAGLGIPF